MGTYLVETEAFSTALVPNPGEKIRAGGGAGTPVMIAGHNGAANGGLYYTALVSGVRVRHILGAGLLVTVQGNDIQVELTDMAGAPVDLASAVKAAVDSDAAAMLLVTTAVEGTGAGISGLQDWTPISAGVQGSIRPIEQELVNRTRLLYEQCGLWGLPIQLRCEDGVDIIVTGMDGLTSTLGSFTVTPTVSADTWYYLYRTAPSTIISSTTAPSTNLRHMNGDATKDYLGCFRSNATPTIVPFIAHRGCYTYESPELVATLAAPAAWTQKSCAARVPPHIRCARLRLAVLGVAGGATAYVRRSGGAGYRSVIAPVNTLTAYESVGLQMTDGSQRVDFQLVGVGSDAALYVDGWDE